jgi:hypothetical protein
LHIGTVVCLSQLAGVDCRDVRTLRVAVRVASNGWLVVVEGTMREASIAGLLHGVGLGVSVA